MSKVKQPGFGGFNLKLLKGRQCIDEYIMFFYTEILMIFFHEGNKCSDKKNQFFKLIYIPIYIIKLT